MRLFKEIREKRELCYGCRKANVRGETAYSFILLVTDDLCTADKKSRDGIESIVQRIPNVQAS